MSRLFVLVVAALALFASFPDAVVVSLPATPLPENPATSLAFQEISAFTASPNSGTNGDSPILSDDGTTIGYTISPGTGDEATPNRIFVVGADGSDPHQVDSYVTHCYCTSVIDLSADGSAIVSTDSTQIRIADAGGSRELFAIASNEINALRISGDGAHIFFRIYRDTATTPGNEPISRGVWTIDPDGTNLRQIVSPSQMEALGLPPTDFFGSNGWTLDSSTDGSRLIFGAFNDPKDAGFGEGLFGVNFDGSGLRDYLGRVGFINNGAISGNGEMVAFVAIDAVSNVTTAGVVDFAGGTPRTLFDSSTSRDVALNGFPDSGDRIQLNADGTQLLLGSTGLLADTGTGSIIALGVPIVAVPPGVAQLVGNGLYRATMSSDASRLLYLSADTANVLQLVLVEVAPDISALPGGLMLGEITVDPMTLKLDGASSATVMAAVAADAPPTGIGAQVLREGLADPNIAAIPLYDDATHGDAGASDAIYSNNALRADCCAVAGPRTLRVQAQGEAGGRRIAVSRDVEGPSVGS